MIPKLKKIGSMAADDLKLGLLELKLNFKLMMVGSLEADINNISKVLSSEVLDDFDDSDSDKDVPIQNTQVFEDVLQFLTSILTLCWFYL